jgi:hypothetical protein
MIMATPFSCILSRRFYGKTLNTSDTKLVSNIFCEYVDVDERKEATLIHDGRRGQDTRKLFIMNL